MFSLRAQISSEHRSLQMNQLRHWMSAARRVVVIAALLLGIWLAGSSEAWAAKRREEPKNTAPAGKSYVLPYGIVMFAIMLGMMAVLRPGRRADEPPRPEEK
jgi:hypothetical protein